MASTTPLASNPPGGKPLDGSCGAADTHKHDVFISYSRQDCIETPAGLKAAGPALAEHLAGRGLRCWLDTQSIHTGDWTEQVGVAILESWCCVVLLSETASKSPHVKDEVAMARARLSESRVLPVMLEDFELPEFWQMQVGRLQRVQAWDRPWEEWTAELLNRIRAVQRAGPVRPIVRQRSRPNWRVRLAVGCGVLGTIGAAIALSDQARSGSGAAGLPHVVELDSAQQLPDPARSAALASLARGELDLTAHAADLNLEPWAARAAQVREKLAEARRIVAEDPSKALALSDQAAKQLDILLKDVATDRTSREQAALVIATEREHAHQLLATLRERVRAMYDTDPWLRVELDALSARMEIVGGTLATPAPAAGWLKQSGLDELATSVETVASDALAVEVLASSGIRVALPNPGTVPMDGATKNQLRTQASRLAQRYYAATGGPCARLSEDELRALSQLDSSVPGFGESCLAFTFECRH